MDPTLTLPPQIPIYTTPGFNPSASQTLQPIKIRPDETGSIVPDKRVPASWQIYVQEGGVLPPNWNKFPTPVEYVKSGKMIVSPGTVKPEHRPGAKDTEKSMDLGDLLGQLGTAFIQTKYAPQAPVQNIVAQSQPAFNIPFVDVVPEAGAQCSTKGMVWNPNSNCGQGKWQKRSRRRRRRLATASDIRDIAALKDTGGPALTKQWIATHPT